MEGANKKHISESFRLAAVLALVGGFLDAYTYICRGQVFSNAQTGNILLVGLALAENNFINAIYHFLPVVAFIVGVIITETIKRRVKFKETFIHWRQIVIGAEIIILFAIAFIPMGRYDGKYIDFVNLCNASRGIQKSKWNSFIYNNVYWKLKNGN